MTTPSTRHTHVPRFMRSNKSALAAAALALVHVYANAQTTPENLVLDEQFYLQGAGRSALLIYRGGSNDVVLGTGDFASSGDPFDIGAALGFLNLNRLQVGGGNGATVSETYASDSASGLIRTSLQASQQVTSLDIQLSGPNAGLIGPVNLAGDIGFSGTRISGTLTGGQLQISQVRLGLATGEVIANLSGTRAAVGTKPSVVFNSPDTVLWTFDPQLDVTGPARLHPASISDDERLLLGAGYTNVHRKPGNPFTWFTASPNIQNLTLTSAGAEFLTNSLGLLATGKDALNAVNTSVGKWGSIRPSLTFQTTLPEPSTYTFMGLGLVGIALAARRKTPSV